MQPWGRKKHVLEKELPQPSSAAVPLGGMLTSLGHGNSQRQSPYNAEHDGEEENEEDDNMYQLDQPLTAQTSMLEWFKSDTVGAPINGKGRKRGANGSGRTSGQSKKKKNDGKMVCLMLLLQNLQGIRQKAVA